jgi:processive 1,2-diacylglycerol beta-glucosyltransferase
MKIVSYSDRNNGCFWYRQKIPFDCLKKNGLDVSCADKGDLVPNDMDLVHFARGYEPGYEKFIFSLKERGVKIWYDLDDAMDLVKPWNPFHIPTQDNLGSYYFYLNQADFITCTSEALKSHLSTLTRKPIFVSPNYFNPDEWRMQRPQTPGKLRVGFAGSCSHLKDLNVVLPVIGELQKKHDFTFVIVGIDMGTPTLQDFYNKHKAAMGNKFEKHPFGIELQKFYDHLKKINHEWNEGVRWELHSRNLARLDLDIGLCPLIDDDFNRCKTPIKFYEYALVGTPSISSKVTPYKEEALALADNDFSSWYDALDAMLTYQELRDSTLKAQRDYVFKNRDVNGHVEDLKKVILDGYAS